MAVSCPAVLVSGWRRASGGGRGFCVHLIGTCAGRASDRLPSLGASKRKAAAWSVFRECVGGFVRLILVHVRVGGSHRCYVLRRLASTFVLSDQLAVIEGTAMERDGAWDKNLGIDAEFCVCLEAVRHSVSVRRRGISFLLYPITLAPEQARSSLQGTRAEDMKELPHWASDLAIMDEYDYVTLERGSVWMDHRRTRGASPSALHQTSTRSTTVSLMPVFPYSGGRVVTQTISIGLEISV